MIYVVTNQILTKSKKYKVIGVKESLKLLSSLKKVGLDTETTGFDPYTKDLILVQLGCYNFQVVIDVTTISMALYKEYLESNRLFIGWNIKFDIGFLLHQGIMVKNTYDGFLSEKALWIGYPGGFHSMSLQSAGLNYLGVELDKTIRGKAIWAGLSEDVIEYAANDVKYLEPIMDLQIKALKDKGLSEGIILEQMSVPWVAYTEYCGVKLDQKKWSYKMTLDNFSLEVHKKDLDEWVINSCTGKEWAWCHIQTEGKEIKDINKERSKINGERDPSHDIKGPIRGYFEAYKVKINKQLDKKFIKESLQNDLFSMNKAGMTCLINWQSVKQVSEILESLGLNLLVRDKDTGELTKSTEAEILEAQRDVSSIIYSYIEYRGAVKLTSTYGVNVLNQINSVSGRIHTKFNQIGTDTYRLSSGGEDKKNKIKYLNFQNFPNDPETRACFVASPGYKWISCDYSAQESRILADIANEPKMIELYNHGCGDIHSLVAKMTYPDIIGDCPIEEIKAKFHNERNSVKTDVEFPINYGGDYNTIMQHSGKSKEEALQLYNNYMNGFKNIAVYQNTQRAFVMNNGYILLNKKSKLKAYIYDYDVLVGIRKRMTGDFWTKYRVYKGNANLFLPKAVKQQIYKRFASGEPLQDLVGVYSYTKKKGNKEETLNAHVSIEDVYVLPVKHYFRRKSDSEKQAINYPCQHTGAAMFKMASVLLFKYILDNNLLFKVKLCIPSHDEWNIEVPSDMADKMATVLQDCMKKAGAYYCNKLEMPATAEVADYWIH